jgi:uncharacterized PurR-regulated membrane protein YhhQ (DUF165 family)
MSQPIENVLFFPFSLGNDTFLRPSSGTSMATQGLVLDSVSDVLVVDVCVKLVLDTVDVMVAVVAVLVGGTSVELDSVSAGLSIN